MESCLLRSIEQYRRIVAHAEQLEALLDRGDPERLRRYTARLQELQDEAAVHDRVFHELLSHSSETWQNHPLFQERTRLLKQIVEMNHLLLPRIRGMMAVTAHELSQIKGGKVAVAGYHQPAPASQRLRSVG